MKRYSLCLAILTLLFSACAKDKESKCVKGRVLDFNPCTRSWAVQILEGPRIRTAYTVFENVIELFDVPFESKQRDDIIYFTYSKLKKQPSRPCIAVMPMPDFSPVDKSLASLSETACP